MAKKLTNIEKVAQILNKPVDKFTDNSSQWIHFQNNDYSICISFDGKGDKFKDLTIAKKVWAVVDEPVICTIKNK